MDIATGSGDRRGTVRSVDATQWNAVIAASAAILGGVITQLSVGFGRRGDRQEMRRQRLADLRREAVDSCRTSALTLRRVLSDPARTDLELVNAKSQFEADIARIHDSDTATALREWATAAFDRAQGVIGVSAEDVKWTLAAGRLGSLWMTTTSDQS